MNQRHPLVSIGIPTYNGASSIHRTIESALHLDFPHLEIIISDNASTDDTARICEAYQARDKRIKCFRQETNTGPTNNFNEVLRRASGTFFMWLGDDDWIDASYVRLCVAHLQNDPSFSLIGGTPHYYRNG